MVKSYRIAEKGLLQRLPQVGREKVLSGAGSNWDAGKLCFFTTLVVPLGVCFMINMSTHYHKPFHLYVTVKYVGYIAQ